MAKTISEMFQVPHLVGALAGIELEVEGQCLPNAELVPSWNVVRDGSLRDGMEYVVKVPAGALKLRENLREVEAAFVTAKTKTDYTFRTSSHVHVNVSNLTMEQVKAIVLLYFMFEGPYTSYCAKHRQGNRFCLRLKDAEQITSLLRSFVRRDSVPSVASAKYMALNLAALKSYGTLEFRTLEGTDDWERIYTWVRALLKLRKVGRDLGSVEAISKHTVEELASLLFTTERLRTLFLKPGWKEEVEYQQSLMLDVFNAGA